MIWILITGCIYGQITWGADLPSVILLWCFIITASSILISTRYSFFLAITIGFGLILFQILEKEYILRPFKTWKNTTFQIDDAIEYAIVFTLIAGVSWISNREIFRSLLKVKASKLELQNERDSLEIKVAERTHELHRAQIEKINSMYQLVEFGRISSGLFHDLMTPLNTLSLVIQQIGRRKSDITTKIQSGTEFQQMEKQAEVCLRTSNRIIEFISLAKRQIQHVDDITKFEVSQEIQNSISLLQSKARQKEVRLSYSNQKKIYHLGSPTLFSHILTNLISNAIDAYDNYENSQPVVLIYLRKKNRQFEIKIKDFGSGIPIEIQSKIFDPFFTTKLEQGCGIGLSATKHTLEKYFNGNISFVSENRVSRQNIRPRSTTFIIKIPLIKSNSPIHKDPSAIIKN
jgi:signal transduction histidine kinase